MPKVFKFKVVTNYGTTEGHYEADDLTSAEEELRKMYTGKQTDSEGTVFMVKVKKLVVVEEK